jgi:hypothetical protein
VLAGELAVLYYAFAWWARPDVPDGTTPFTLYKRSGIGDILLFVGLASPFEILPVHIVLHRWSGTAAWIATSLGLYGALWCIGVVRSLALRPGLIGSDDAIVRIGLLYSLRIPIGSIVRVASVPIPGAVTAPGAREPNVWLEFKEPLEAQRIFGLRTRVRSVALCADDPAALISALHRGTAPDAILR